MKKITLILLLSLICSLKLEAQIKVACVGNSVTYGHGILNREKNSYPAVLQSRFGIAGYIVGNFGRSGATLLTKGHNPYVKSPEYQSALDMKPDIVVLHLGLNDTDPRNYTIYQEEFQSDYLALIESFRTVNPKVRVIIARLSPIFHWHWRFNAGTRDWYRKIQQEIEHIAKISGSELIDFQEVLYHHPYLLPDAIHPNDEGARMLAERVYQAISGDFGGLHLSPLYTNNMVLQRGEKTVISGKANRGEKITVKLYNQKTKIEKSTHADKNGKWSIEMPLKEYADYTLDIASDLREITFNNVSVGEVWLLSGQSNMAYSVSMCDSAQLAIATKNIRLFKCNPAFESQDSLSAQSLEQLNRLDYIRSDGWQEADSEAIKDFSAVGYYFAQKLVNSLPEGARIGLIQTALGGAAAEGFVDRHTMEGDALLVDMLNNWTKNPMVMQWVRDVATRGLKGATVANQRHFFEPTYLYESRIHRIKDYTIKGVIWYQGESNAENIELHEVLFPAVVSTFRRAFSNKELPFYFVQLSSLNRPSWCRFRDSQRRLATSIDNCEMVVSSDYGHPTDVHPRIKNPIGERLAAIALSRDYGQKEIQYRSPEAIELLDNKITFTEYGTALRTSDGKAVRGFEAASNDKIFTPVEAQIDGNTIIISHKNPKFVRYGWQPYTDANVINSATLPLSTFQICQTKK